MTVSTNFLTSSFPLPDFPTANLAAVALAVLAFAADKELFATQRAKRLSEYKS